MKQEPLLSKEQALNYEMDNTLTWPLIKRFTLTRNLFIWWATLKYSRYLGQYTLRQQEYAWRQELFDSIINEKIKRDRQGAIPPNSGD